MGGPHGWLGASPSYDPFSQLQNPFLSSLNLPDLVKVTNDPIYHDPWWPPMPTKLPFDIPKFEGNPRENPFTNITTYHLWCSSNSLVDDYVKVRLFQCTLTRDAKKWYIELDIASYGDFASLAQNFSAHF